ncbi:hypothetical protein DsansV1_C03g0028701 [Dioscorea sansibarensis]
MPLGCSPCFFFSQHVYNFFFYPPPPPPPPNQKFILGVFIFESSNYKNFQLSTLTLVCSIESPISHN